MRYLKTQDGQFIPMSAMVMLTIVVFMVAVVNVYKVTRAKLKVQNLADAAALNIASQEAQALNTVADRNEWLNHLYADSQGSSTPGSNPCAGVDDNHLPGISCAEFGGTANYTFHSKPGAENYARLVRTINEAQQLFTDTYNNFIGAGDRNNRSLSEILKADIPDLRDPSVHVIAWNDASHEQEAKTEADKVTSDPTKPGDDPGGKISPHMKDLKFKTHDMHVRYENPKLPLLPQTYTEANFSKLLNQNDPVGWLEMPGENDTQAEMPRIKIGNKSRIGAGVYVVKNLNLFGVPVAVSAKSVAYVVNDSGQLPGANQSGTPHFSPTYWVKLGK